MARLLASKRWIAADALRFGGTASDRVAIPVLKLYTLDWLHDELAHGALSSAGGVPVVCLCGRRNIPRRCAYLFRALGLFAATWSDAAPALGRAAVQAPPRKTGVQVGIDSPREAVAVGLQRWPCSSADGQESFSVTAEL